MKIVAEIAAVPLARYRLNTSTKGRFLPTKSSVFRRELAFIAKAQMKREIFTTQLVVTIHFYKPLKINSRIYGDIDNLVKAVLDALNGIVWADDSLIVELHALKHYGAPKIEIEIEEASL